MIKAGVIGFPINHSKSPTIHNYWLKKYGINASYDKYEVRERIMALGISLYSEVHGLILSGMEADFLFIADTKEYNFSVFML